MGAPNAEKEHYHEPSDDDAGAGGAAVFQR